MGEGIGFFHKRRKTPNSEEAQVPGVRTESKIPGKRIEEPIDLALSKMSTDVIRADYQRASELLKTTLGLEVDLSKTSFCLIDPRKDPPKSIEQDAIALNAAIGTPVFETAATNNQEWMRDASILVTSRYASSMARSLIVRALRVEGNSLSKTINNIQAKAQTISMSPWLLESLSPVLAQVVGALTKEATSHLFATELLLEKKIEGPFSDTGVLEKGRQNLKDPISIGMALRDTAVVDLGQLGLDVPHYTLVSHQEGWFEVGEGRPNSLARALRNAQLIISDAPSLVKESFQHAFAHIPEPKTIDELKTQLAAAASAPVAAYRASGTFTMLEASFCVLGHLASDRSTDYKRLLTNPSTLFFVQKNAGPSSEIFR